MASPMSCSKRIISKIFKKPGHPLSLSFCRYSHVKKSVAEIFGKSITDTPNIHIQGWVRSVREHKNVIFIHITDGSCSSPVQVVVDPKLCGSDVTYGSCISVRGTLIESPSSGQPYELQASKVDVLGFCDPVQYPFKVKKRHSSDYTRNFPHLRPRTNFMSALMRVRSSATMAMHKFFQDNGYCYVHTPILTSNDCEGAGEVFVVEPEKSEIVDEIKDSDDESTSHNFFGTPAFLTVSGQLHLEAVTGAFTKVYNFGPTFRAENSRGRHHLSEFYMVEAEIAFTETLEDIMKVFIC
ncbi:hypothetical protein ScPMuIL_010479 [Solemya velum]